ncbi:unnamed protein product, partial [Brenthis ino]
MEFIPKNSILEFNPDTLQSLRKQYDLDKPGRIAEAINLLEEWIKKQPHFVVKSFTRDYLERTIIISKGSVERAKMKLDRICTARTLYPYFFGVPNVKEVELLKVIIGAFMPKLTKEHYRIYTLNNQAKAYPKGYREIYQYFFMQCEYIQTYDYCNGLLLFIDYRDADLMEALKAFTLSDMRNAVNIIKEGYGMRIKGIHLLSESKAIDAIVVVLKQAFSAKVASRIVVHKTLDTLYEYIPKHMLPKDYGGDEKPLIELHEQFLDVLTSKEFTDYLTEMNKACTNEELRMVTDEERFMGVPGSFRSLSVD